MRANISYTFIVGCSLAWLLLSFIPADSPPIENFGMVHSRVSENLHDVLDDEQNEAVRPHDANDSSWNRLHVMEGPYPREKSARCENCSATKDTPGRRVKKNPCVLAANTVRKSDMDTIIYKAHWICLYVNFSTLKYLTRNESSSDELRHMYNINIDPPQATLPNNDAMLHTTGKFHIYGNLPAST